MREMALGITQRGCVMGWGQKVQGGGPLGKDSLGGGCLAHSLTGSECPACRNLGREGQRGQKSGGQSPASRPVRGTGQSLEWL